MKETEYLKDRQELVDMFKGFPFLGGLGEDSLRNMLELSKLRNCQPGEVIASEGEYDSYMYIIVSGRVRVEKHGEHITKFGNQGDIFGEMAIIDGAQRSASIIADLYTTCLAIDASFIERLPEERRDACAAVFYRMLAEILAQRLRQNGEELVRLKEKSQDPKPFKSKVA